MKMDRMLRIFGAINLCHAGDYHQQLINIQSKATPSYLPEGHCFYQIGISRSGKIKLSLCPQCLCGEKLSEFRVADALDDLVLQLFADRCKIGIVAGYPDQQVAIVSRVLLSNAQHIGIKHIDL